MNKSFDTSTALPTAQGATLRTARVLSEIFAPWVVIVLLSLALSWRTSDYQLVPTLIWAAVLALFSALLPMAFIVRGARAGRWDGHHVRDRAGRLLPLLVCTGSCAAGLLILLLGHAPRGMIVAAVTMVILLLIVLPITSRWKISLHTAVMAGGVAMLCVVYSPWMLLLLLAVAVVCWSRVVVRHHTTTQVIGGAVLGFAVGLSAFVIAG